eukprot:TRINITY_DN8677_c0_g1_i9.p1 TRINITY_DN8677_c0_g1~~TRINITY_DN8677_c0_g1_i9.p1  ORF type:complete len:106 (-),score=6.57 TRINITY_DN8677_c0_g1_i9:3802-4119(-)
MIPKKATFPLCLHHLFVLLNSAYSFILWVASSKNSAAVLIDSIYSRPFHHQNIPRVASCFDELPNVIALFPVSRSNDFPLIPHSPSGYRKIMSLLEARSNPSRRH